MWMDWQADRKEGAKINRARESNGDMQWRREEEVIIERFHTITQYILLEGVQFLHLVLEAPF